MSGGHFEYSQYKIGEIADDIQHEIDNNGRALTREELKECSWRDDEYYEKHPEDKFYREYPKEVLDKFKEAVNHLRKAHIYAQRVDWLLSGDDGEESFLRRLKEELDELHCYK